MSDRDDLRTHLDAGRDEFLAAVSGLGEEYASVKPAAGGWSTLECAEHVATVETLLLRRLKTKSVTVEKELGREREAELFQRLAARGRKVEAPELALPRGRYASLTEAVAAFLAAREHTVRWLESCDFDLRRRSVEHPLLGPASAYEFFLIIAAHPARHARQIRELRESSTR